MKQIVSTIAIFALLAVAGVASADRAPTSQDTATAAPQSSAVTVTRAWTTAFPERLMSMPADPLKKCGFDSDCSHGKCKSGKCGGCGFDSECKGWGKCKSGQCGACGFDSECKGFGKCKSGKCEKSPY